MGEDNEKWEFVAHYTYSYDLLLLLLLLVMMTMVHSQSGTVFAAVCTTGIGWCGAKQFFGQHTLTQWNFFFFYLLFLLPLGPRSAVAVV